MPVLDPSCFLGLSQEERREQLYLALGGEDNGCFLGLQLMDQYREMLELIGSEACIFTPWDFWAAWLAFLDPEACVGMPLEGLQQAVYALLYVESGDDALPSPECLLGLGPDGIIQAIVEVAQGGGVVSDVYYIDAENGDDSNSGFTESAPWRSIDRLNEQTLLPGNTVYFQGGQFHPGEILLTDSGMEDDPITFTSYGEGAAFISGGVKVTGWVLDDADRNIWVAPFAAVTGRPRNVWVNGVRCTRPSRIIPAGVTLTATGLSTAASASPGFADDYTRRGDIELVFRMYWQEQRIPLDGAAGTPNELTFTPEGMVSMLVVYGYHEGALLTIPQAAYRIENAPEIFEAVASSRTFYHDRETDELFLIPPVGVNPNEVDVIVPIQEQTFYADGVHDIEITNLGFSHTTFLVPSEPRGFVEVQAGVFENGTAPVYLNVPDPMPRAAVWIENSDRVRVTGCQFTNLGNWGLRMEGNTSTGYEIIGNYFSDNSGGAIIHGNQFSHTAGGPTDTEISNNLIRRCGREFHGACGIIHFYGPGVNIHHNLLYDLPYTGISVGWGWNNALVGNTNVGTRVHHNLGYRLVQQMTDGGGLYSNSFHTDAVYEENYMHDIGNINDDASIAYYLDNGSNSGIDLRNNVCHTVLGPVQIRFNDPSSMPTTSVPNIVQVGLGTAAGSHTDTSLAGCIAAGEAFNAGLEAEYAYLETDNPDETLDGDWINGLVFDGLAENSSSSEVTVAIDRMVNSSELFDLVQFTEAQQPQVVPNQLNGLPLFRFDGTDQMVSLEWTREIAFTLIVVIRRTSDTEFNPFISNGDPSAPGNGWGYWVLDDKRTGSAWGVGDAVDGEPSIGWEIVTLRRNAVGNWSLWVNLSNQALVGSPVPVPPFGGVVIAAVGDIAAMRVYPYALPDDQVTSVVGVLNEYFF